MLSAIQIGMFFADERARVLQGMVQIMNTHSRPLPVPNTLLSLKPRTARRQLLFLWLTMIPARIETISTELWVPTGSLEHEFWYALRREQSISMGTWWLHLSYDLKWRAGVALIRTLNCLIVPIQLRGIRSLRTITHIIWQSILLSHFTFLVCDRCSRWSTPWFIFSTEFQSGSYDAWGPTAPGI